MPNCSALTNHCCIKIDQTYTPCCRYEDAVKKFSINDYSFDGYKQSDFYNKLVNNMSQGWDHGCRSCQLEESIGKESLRQKYNKRFSGVKDRLEFIEINSSNHCNLACKMCNNVSSSKWQTILNNNPVLLDFDFEGTPIESKNAKRAFEGVDLSNLREIKFLGGEPFISQEFFNFINFLDSATDLSKINFKCNTNATFFPSKAIEFLNKFKSTMINISIDGMGDLCNFVRTGETWEAVLIIIDKWKQLANEKSNYILSVHMTVQAYNLHQFDDIKSFAINNNFYFSYKILDAPKYLSLSALPREYISELNITNSSIKAALSMIEFDQKLFERLRSYTETTDNILNTSIQKTIPKLFNYF